MYTMIGNNDDKGFFELEVWVLYVCKLYLALSIRFSLSRSCLSSYFRLPQFRR